MTDKTFDEQIERARKAGEEANRTEARAASASYDSWLAGPLIFAAIIIFALSLLQWKDVADGLPEVEGQYSVVKGSGKTPFYLTFPKAEDKSAYAQIVRMMWAEEIAAYIPVPIPEWKEQR